MYIGPDLPRFVRLLFQIASEEDLRELMTEMAWSIGLPKFALVSHVDLIGAAAEAVAISNYHEDWIDRIYARRYFIDDPIHAASTRKVIAFAWHDAPSMITLSKRQRSILTEAAGFGLVDGITVPVHAPGEYRGTCSFGADHPVRLTIELGATTQVVASYAFEAARHLVRSRLGLEKSWIGVPSLSGRQLDCVHLVAVGHGDAQIAHRLGLAESTVHQHVGEAMRRYGVIRRSALIYRTIFDGQICFHFQR